MEKSTDMSDNTEVCVPCVSQNVLVLRPSLELRELLSWSVISQPTLDFMGVISWP